MAIKVVDCRYRSTATLPRPAKELMVAAAVRPKPMRTGSGRFQNSFGQWICSSTPRTAKVYLVQLCKQCCARSQSFPMISTVHPKYVFQIKLDFLSLPVILADLKLR